MDRAQQLRQLGQHAGAPHPSKAKELLGLLAQTWPARGAKAMLSHTGDVLAGLKDAGDVEGALDTIGGAMMSGFAAPMRGALGAGPIRHAGRDVDVTAPKYFTEGELVPMDVGKVDKGWQRDTLYVGPGGEGGMPKRYAGIQEYLKNATEMEAPRVAVWDDGRVVFNNGRHRFSYLRDQGLEELPIFLDPDSAANARRLGYVK